MCDYSLEMYRSRPARIGERYVSHRFASGSVGFIAPGDPDTAICMACDSKVTLTKLPAYLFGMAPAGEVHATFIRLDDGPHHDGLRFDSGLEMTLQQLGPGAEAWLEDELATPISERQLESSGTA